MWYRNVKEAFLALFVWEGLLALLIQIDRLGNALCGGNPKATVSGRTGYFAGIKQSKYWRCLAALINFTFKPLDGRNHCHKAWYIERKYSHNRSSDVALFGLSLVILVTCPFICIVTYGRKLWAG